MRQSLKIAISLLVSLLLFAGFSVLAFSGLFNVVQASFFLPRLEKASAEDIASLAASIDTFHKGNLEVFTAAAAKDFVGASFSQTLPASVTAAWSDFASQQGIGWARLLGSDGRRLWFSTLETDRKPSAAGTIVFANYTDDPTAAPADQVLVPPGSSPRVLIDGAHDSFLYLVPAAGSGQVGTLIVSVLRRELLTRLSLSQSRAVNSITLVGRAGILLDDPGVSSAAYDALSALWSGSPPGGSPQLLTLKAADGTQSSWRVFTAPLANGGYASIMVSASSFEMSDLMKALLLVTFFLTVFLLLFLILNLRTDPLEVLRQRVKRFQVELITELVESPGGADWGRWRREMESRKDEITWQIQRGIGRVSRKKKPVIDEYMTKSWAEIIDLISRRTETPAVTGPAIDVSRLESLIKSALQNANFIIPAQKVQQDRPQGLPQGRAQGRPLQVEEISADEVTDAAPEPVDVRCRGAIRRPGCADRRIRRRSRSRRRSGGGRGSSAGRRGRGGRGSRSGRRSSAGRGGGGSRRSRGRRGNPGCRCSRSNRDDRGARGTAGK